MPSRSLLEMFGLIWVVAYVHKCVLISLVQQYIYQTISCIFLCKKKAFCLQCSHYEAVKWQFDMVMMLFSSGSSSLIQAYVTVQLEVSTLHFWISIKNSRNVTVKMKPNEICQHINYSLLVLFLYLGSSVSILQENSSWRPFKIFLMWPLYDTCFRFCEFRLQNWMVKSAVFKATS